jgi:hypothetical protein
VIGCKKNHQKNHHENPRRNQSNTLILGNREEHNEQPSIIEMNLNHSSDHTCNKCAREIHNPQPYKVVDGKLYHARNEDCDSDPQIIIDPSSENLNCDDKSLNQTFAS